MADCLVRIIIGVNHLSMTPIMLSSGAQSAGFVAGELAETEPESVAPTECGFNPGVGTRGGPTQYRNGRRLRKRRRPSRERDGLLPASPVSVLLSCFIRDRKPQPVHGCALSCGARLCRTLDQDGDRTLSGLSLSVQAQRALPNAICRMEMRPEEPRQSEGGPHPPDAAVAPAGGGRRKAHLHLRRAQSGVPGGGGGERAAGDGVSVAVGASSSRARSLVRRLLGSDGRCSGARRAAYSVPGRGRRMAARFKALATRTRLTG